MALLFFDSFDHYTGNQGGQGKWVTQGYAIVAGRRSPSNPNSNGAQAGSPVTSGLGTLTSTVATACIGSAYNTPSLGGNILTLEDLFGGSSVILQHVGDGRIQMVIGNVAQTPVPNVTLSVSTWYYLELYMTITGSPGAVTATCSVFFNGNPVAAQTIALARTWSTLTIASWAIGGPINAIYDDLYVTDGENLGDITIGCIYPRSDGTFTAWTPNPAGSHFSNVNAHTPGDVNFNSAAVAQVNSKDSYFLDLLAGGLAIKGIQLVQRVNKSDAGVGTFASILRNTGGTEDQSATFSPSATSYAYFLKPYRKSPFTALDFTVTEINASQLEIIRLS